MNQDQTLYVRISHDGNTTEQIEAPNLRGAFQAAYESFVSHQGRKVLMNIEISNQPLTKSLLTREQQLEHESMNMAISDPDEIVYPPDVTLQECNEAWSSESGQAMFKYQRAENRMGVDSSVLEVIKSQYESKFPRVAPHGPKWTNT